MDPLDERVQGPEEQYNSEEDEDFNPTTAEAQDDELSESSAEEDGISAAPVVKAPKGSKKRAQAQVGAGEELDSGDEATIQELKKRKKRKKQDDDDSGGEGGLIKTRAQRAAEKQEKAEYRRSDKGSVTVDVDSLWAKLSSAPIGRRQPEEAPSQQARDAGDGDIADGDGAPSQLPANNTDDDEMITIHRSYNFAGQKVTEEKRVHKSSAEAKLWLASHDPSKNPQKHSPSPEAAVDSGSGPQLRRPLRRASRFEPNPTGEVKGIPLERQRLRAPTRADVLAQQQRKEEEDKRKGKVQKLTTVQKSAIDWAAHVDREGFKEELDIYGRSKQGFMGRMEFMRGVEGRKEAEEREARLAKSAATATPTVGL